MAESSSTIIISQQNDARRPRPVFIEPWGEDYWLFPGDHFKINAFSYETAPHFAIYEGDDTTQVYLEGKCHEFAVYHDEQKVAGGYQRAKLAGIADHAFTIKGRGAVITSDHQWQVKWKRGDELRLVTPKPKVLKAFVSGLEHISTVPGVIL